VTFFARAHLKLAYRVSAALAQLGETIEHIDVDGGGVDLDVFRIVTSWNKTALQLHPYIFHHVGIASSH